MLFKIKVFLLFLVFLFSSYKVISIIRVRNMRMELTPMSSNVTSEILPVSLKIDSITLNVPVTPATLVGGSWEYSENSVSYLKVTPTPGEPGNSVLYGHNWPNLLGNLKKTKPGDLLTIELSNGEIRSFSMRESYIVTPDQTHILEQAEDTKLTIYTCTGFFDSRRLVVVFEPVF